MAASVWQGTVRLFGVKLVVHVLDTGQRVVEEKSLIELFTVMQNDESAGSDSEEAAEFARFLRGTGVPPTPATAAREEGER